MSRQVLITSILSVAVGSMGFAQAAELNVWNWSDYIAEHTLEKYKQQTGIKDMNYALFDSNEMVEARMLSGHTGFDAIVITSYYVPRLAKAGALQKIDHSKIPNWGNLDKAVMAKLAELDPNNDYAYPYAANTIGIGYNKKKVAEIFGEDYKVDSWDFLFNKENSTKLKQCGIAIIDSPIEIVSTVQHYLGLDPTSEKMKDYKKAQKILTDLAGNTAYLHSSRFINDLASGEICVAIGYSGDILQAADRGRANGKGIEIDYVVPKEGGLMWYDCWTVPVGAEHYDTAMGWFDFLLQPEIAAEISNEIRYVLPVTDAIPLMDDVLNKNPSVALSPEMLDKMYFVKPTSATLSKITNRVWNAMKLNSGKDSEEEEGGWN